MKIKLAYLSYFVITFLFVAPLFTQSIHGWVWLSWNFPNYYFNLIDQYNSIQYVWKEMYGMVFYPFLFDVQYYWLFRSLQFILQNGYYAWLAYVYVIFAVAGISFSLYLRKLYSGISVPVSLLLGLFYTSFIPVNYEVEYFDIKIVSAFLPLMLYLLVVLYEHMKEKRVSYLTRTIPLILSLFALDFLVLEPRGFIAYGITACIQLIVFFYLDRDKKSFLKTAVLLFLSFVGTVILYIPVNYAQNVLYSSSTQLTVQIADAIYLYNTILEKIMLFPDGLMSVSSLTLIIASLTMCCSLVGFLFLRTTNKRIYILSLLLFVLYLVFINYHIVTLITEHLAYGQLFRSWRISQFIANLLFPLLLTGIFIRKNVFVKGVTSIIIICFVAVSIYQFKQSFGYIAKSSLNQYQAADAFLNSDAGNEKVLWTPEMGWFGKNTKPTWGSPNFSGQGFPEMVSAKPTYYHYYSAMTQPYTWLASGHWQSELQNNQHVANLLNILGIKYVVVHNDVPGYKDDTDKIQVNLSNSSDFKQVEQDGTVSVFQNFTYQSRIWVTPLQSAVLCNGGLQCLTQYYNNDSIYQTSAFLSDTTLPSSILANITNFYSPDYVHNTFADMIINDLQQKHETDVNILWAKNYTDKEKRIACVSDTHSGVYHDYWQVDQTYDYANNFDFTNCFFFLANHESFTTPAIHLPKNQYTMLIKYMKHAEGGSFSVSSPLFNLSLPAKKDKAINYYDYATRSISVTSDTRLPITFSNKDGNNAIAYVAFIPSTIYQQEMATFQKQKHLISGPVASVASPIVHSVAQQSPVSWSAWVSATKPFVLNFAETYNPLWQAEIYKDDKQVAVIPAVTGYGMINSFVVNQTGNLSIKIVYQPQNTYNTLLLVSVGVYLILMAGLVISLKKLP